MTADDRAAGPKTDRPGNASTLSVPPTYPRGGDPRRRAVLRERLHLRRRNAKAFDRWAPETSPEPDGDTDDWWFDIGMTLTVEERERAGGGA